jgi:hypothetical protein
MQREKPVGITAIGVINIIGDSIYIIGGIISLIIISNLSQNILIFGISSNSIAAELLTSSFGVIISGGLIVLGITNVFASICFLKNKNWALNLNVILAITSVAVDIIILGLHANIASVISAIIGCLIDVGLLYYFYRPNVREYFGKITLTGSRL